MNALPGDPDVVFTRAGVVVFCDGDFWHGRNWDVLRTKLASGTNPGYWQAKIGRNIERDRANAAALEALGWRVVRLWETDIMKDVEAAARYIEEILRRAKPSR